MKRKIAYIRLDEQSEEAIAQKIKDTGVNQSEAIRLIIREWSQMKAQYITVPVVGKVEGNLIQAIEPDLDKEIERRR